MEDYERIKSEALELVSRYALRDEMYEDLRRMYHMQWREVPTGDWIKPTMSPTAYNVVIGATRLMLSSEPQVSVAYDQTDTHAKRTSERIERWCKAVWMASGRARQRPPHYDALFSATLFGLVVGGVSRTSDLLLAAKRSGNKAQERRMAHLVKTTPYLFEVYNPMTCYPDFDVYGLRALLRRYRCSIAEAAATYGTALENAIPDVHTRRATDEIEINDWYDWERRVVWVEGGGDPILCEEHGLCFLPVVAQLTEGSAIFSKPEEACTPMLYAVYRSDMWKRENLSLTTIFSLMYALASSPLLVRKTSEPGKPMTIDRSVPGAVVDIAPDETLTPLAEKVIDESLITGMNLIERLMQESTISKHTLGLPPAFEMPYSAISLLSQSGRLPLVGTMVLGGLAIANMMSMALRWYKEMPEPMGHLIYANRRVELDPTEIPDNPVIEVRLEPDVPQDKLQMANTAAVLANTGLASKRWTREKILQIGQSGSMDKEIFFERLMEAETERRLAELQVPKPVAPTSGASGVYPPGGVQPGAPLAGPLPRQEHR